MKSTRRKFTAAFKAKVVLEALTERLTLADLAVKHEIHPQQIATWKKEFLDNAEKVFAKDNDKESGKKEVEIDGLYRRIGQLNMENEWLKKRVL